MRPSILIAGAVAIVFGVASVLSGGMALFGGVEARAAVGNAVGFVLWFNFIAGFAYVVAGAGLVMQRRWAAMSATLILAATLVVFAAFGIHVASGGAYEPRTVGAMALRSVVWAAIAWTARVAAAKGPG